jgi:hypothetical protein
MYSQRGGRIGGYPVAPHHLPHVHTASGRLLARWPRQTVAQTVALADVGDDGNLVTIGYC